MPSKLKLNSIAVEAFLLINIVSICLLLFRIFYTGYLTYLFLFWNLFLAFIPLLMALLLKKNSNNKILNTMLLIIWVLFLPNAPYIVTDLKHVYYLGSVMPVWFDLILVISFALSGLLAGFYSLYLIQIKLVRPYGHILELLFCALMLLLSSVGVYVGRFLRWNSWHVVTDPIFILKGLLSNEVFNIQMIIFSGLFFLFLLLIYIPMLIAIEYKNVKT